MLFSKLVSIGIDIGGSHISCLLIDEIGTLQFKTSLAVTDRSVEAILELIVQVVKNVYLNGIKQNRDMQVLGIGLGIPGNVDPNTGVARYLPNFGWQDVKLRLKISNLLASDEELKAIADLPILMRNDGRCAALAESEYGSGKQSKVFAMLTLGTGIGGALIIQNTLFDGVSFDAGDFGHHVICSGSDAFDCVCGKRGCFEVQASAQGLVRHYIKMTSRDKDFNAQNIIDLMRCGESTALSAWENYLNDLSTGLANLVTFYNPDTIALGGGLSQATELFETIEDHVHKKSLQATRGIVRIIPATLGTDAGAIGAALLGFSTRRNCFK